MNYEREEHRPDQTGDLGKRLSAREQECYGIICQSGITPISVKDIYMIMWDCTDMHIPDDRIMNHYVGTNLTRIRKRLGKEAIIYMPGFGYIAQTELINHLVTHNVENNTNLTVNELFPDFYEL